jgi:glycosyltransferase involved in cell wall biosynthesis/ubiquinone/menaquinone biosynthesis C-methylase UbiE
METLPFHQYQRYKILQQIIDGVRKSNQCLRILEVGSGSHKNAEKFLPNDEFLYLDIVIPHEVKGDSQFVQGDATNLTFLDDTFDFVIALDVYEHIPELLREKFLKEIFRVSKNGFILSAPFTNFGLEEVEKRLDVISDAILEYKLPWITEHFESGLPNLEKTVNFINKDLKADHFYFTHGSKDLSEKLLRMELFTARDYRLFEYLKEIHMFYNQNMLWNDFDENGIRTFILGFKNRADIEKVANKIAELKRLPDISNQETMSDLERSFYRLGQALSVQEPEIRGRCQLFIDDGAGFSEFKSFSTIIKKNRNIIEYDLSTFTDIKALRFDPLDSKCSILIRNVKVFYENNESEELLPIATNCDFSEDEHYIFSNNDPQILFNIEEGKELVRIRFEVEYFLFEKAIESKMTQRHKKKEELEVDVLLITYNHQEYISQAIESILMQQCSFNVNIIVSDDGSRDETLNIILRYKKKYPNKITILDHRDNVGITKNYQRAFSASTSNYVAVLEGDDYWTSPYKLERQVIFLNEHRECSLCFHRLTIYDMTKMSFSLHQLGLSVDKPQLLNVTDLVWDNFIGNFSCCMYRRSVLNMLDEAIYTLKAYDWMLNMSIAQFGMIGFLPEVMSVYRLHNKGTWTKKDQQTKVKEIIDVIEEYNCFFEYRYQDEFDAHRQRLILQLSPIGQKISPRWKKVLKEWLPPIVLRFLKYGLQKVH